MRTSLEGYPGNTVVVSLYIPEMPWACFVLLCFVSHQKLVRAGEMVFPYPDKADETGGELCSIPEKGSSGTPCSVAFLSFTNNPTC